MIMNEQASKIILQGISPEELNTELLKGISECLEKLVATPEPNPVKYYTRLEVAEMLSVSLPTIHDWCKKDILKPYRLGSRIYFKSDELELSLKSIPPRR